MATLRELSAAGELATGRRARRTDPRVQGLLPEVAILQVLSVDADGDVWATPAEWHGSTPAPRIHLIQRPGTRAAGMADRVLAKLRTADDGSIEGRPIRILEPAAPDVLGVYEVVQGQGYIRPVNRRTRTDYRVRGADSGGAKPGEVVVADVVGRAGLGAPQARVRERVGGMDDPRTLSLIAIHEHGIPNRFSNEAVREAEAGALPALGKRTDFRSIPFVTIDPSDARDFDDAIWAAQDTDPANAGGWHVRVAIADVAHYVRPGSALDREAHERGNSVYFPDRVVPMLPEALSGGMCSLKQDEDRACLVATIWLDPHGTILRHSIERGLMRSVRRIEYERAQEIYDHGGDAETAALLQPLYAAYGAFKKARAARDPLNIESRELVVRLGTNGRVADIHPRPHLDSHQLVEEFMIAANIAAAETIGRSKLRCMYRIHAEPDPERVEALRVFLESLDIKLTKGQRLMPRQFNLVLDRVRGTPHQEAVNQIILRTQSQAIYSPENIGHYGLSLRNYVHFTSPIRRYADLLIHRALIRSLGLGDDGLPEMDHEEFGGIAAHISMTERRAMLAERDATDRYLAAFLSDRTGAEFLGRISGVGKAGVFITLLDIGAQALIPMRRLGDERYELDDANQAIVGTSTGAGFRLGDTITVRLVEATPATGGLIAEAVSSGSIKGDGHKRRGPKPKPRHFNRRR